MYPILGWLSLCLGVFAVVLAFLIISRQGPQVAPEKYVFFRASLKPDYPFAMTEAELRTLVGRVNAVHIGDTRQSVETLLGEPWSDEPFVPKETPRIDGRIVEYYVTKSDPDIANNHDKVVIFMFDTKDRLVRITSNVGGIPSRQ
jgi:hypothetical protein